MAEVDGPEVSPNSQYQTDDKSNFKSNFKYRFLPAIAVGAVTLSLIAVGTSIWLWSEQLAGRELTQQWIAAIEADLRNTRAQLGQETAREQALVTQRLQEVEGRQSTMQTRLDELHERMGSSARDWVAAEAGYLMQVAQYRLSLERDASTARTALKLADDRIRSLGDPALLPVRTELAREITALSTLAVPDIEGISATLAALERQSDQLPLRERVSSNNPKDPNAVQGEKSRRWTDIPQAIWDALRGLITVRYNDRPVDPLLSPQQINYLFENLALKLEAARYAALRANESLYQTNLQLAVDWLWAYFDTTDLQTQTVLAKLESLKANSVAPTLPNISGSSAALKLAVKSGRFHEGANP